MSFTPDQARVQFSALNQRINDKPVVFLDGPGGSQVPHGAGENDRLFGPLQLQSRRTLFLQSDHHGFDAAGA